VVAAVLMIVIGVVAALVGAAQFRQRDLVGD
jgi:hypothetical protein